MRGNYQKCVGKAWGEKVGRLPKKSSAAEMMVEAQIFSKMQVHDAMLASTNNVLHTDGTKYKFNEIGSYQVTTDSGSYTLGIEEMLSGEASTYMETFRQLLNEISAFGTAKDGNSSPVALKFYPGQNNIKLKFGELMHKGISSYQKKIPVNPSPGNRVLGAN